MNDEENFIIDETIKPKIAFKIWFLIPSQIKINSSKPKIFFFTTRQFCYNNNLSHHSCYPIFIFLSLLIRSTISSFIINNQ